MTSDGTQIILLAFFGVGEEGVFHCIADDFISVSKW